MIKDNVIEMEKDDNGMNVINKERLDDVLASSVVKFDDFHPGVNGYRALKPGFTRSVCEYGKFDWAEKGHQTMVKSTVASFRLISVAK